MTDSADTAIQPPVADHQPDMDELVRQLAEERAAREALEALLYERDRQIEALMARAQHAKHVTSAPPPPSAPVAERRPAIAEVALPSAERTSFQEQLSASWHLIRLIIEHAPSYIFVKDLQRRFLVCNQRTADLCDLQVQDLIGKSEEIFFPAEDVQRWRAEDQRVIESGQMVQYEEETNGPTGLRHHLATKFPIFDTDGTLVAVGGIITDMTELHLARLERQNLEERTRESQRLESLGVLAGGIAHDFNNILTGVLGHAEFALLDLPAGSSAATSVAEIIAGVRRAAELTGQMLAYSGKGRFVLSTLKLADLVREMSGFVRISIPKKVTVVYGHGRNEAPIMADATQIRQVIMNLILNAAEAIGDVSGLVSVHTGRVAADDRRLRKAQVLPEQTAAAYAFLEVRDTGSGMTPDVIARLFDPFFTTKFTGRGLGMSVVLGIMRGHAGAIAIESEPGQGTLITVFFPVAELPAEPTLSQQAEERSDDVRRVVLIVDDEPQVLTIACRMVERLGYVALAAATAGQALKLCRERTERIDCVLLDLTMPEMDGFDLLGLLRSVRPGLRAILCSGFSEQYATERFGEQEYVGFLPKPYRIDDLRRMLNETFRTAN